MENMSQVRLYRVIIALRKSDRIMKGPWTPLNASFPDLTAAYLRLYVGRRSFLRAKGP